MTYAKAGVDYPVMDRFKRACQEAGCRTAERFQCSGISEVEWSRGESVHLTDIGDRYIGHVEEGLGTKNLVADAMRLTYATNNLTAKSYYDQAAQDTVAMIVNDMTTLGVRPVGVAMHLAVGSSDWFQDERRCQDVVTGWQKACLLARCIWDCGETPTLRKIVAPETVLLSGSAWGIVQPKERLIECNIRPGDVIILVESSGIHANGLTLAREIAEKLPDGYFTRLGDGRSYGETLLDPTHIYVPLVEDCLDQGVHIRYAVNITGHGWRKLMRARRSFEYIIEQLPRQLPIFDFIQKHGPVSDEEAYGTFNMGAGFALYIPQQDIGQTVEIAAGLGLTAFPAGHIRDSYARQVTIIPKNLRFPESTLQVR